MPSVFRHAVSLDALNALSANTVISQLGIVFTAVGDDWLQATMPVDARTHQPYGILHGGASVVLAETLGSSAGNLCVPDDRICVGIEINANHLRAARDGVERHLRDRLARMQRAGRRRWRALQGVGGLEPDRLQRRADDTGPLGVALCEIGHAKRHIARDDANLRRVDFRLGLLDQARPKVLMSGKGQQALEGKVSQHAWRHAASDLGGLNGDGA